VVRTSMSSITHSDQRVPPRGSNWLLVPLRSQLEVQRSVTYRSWARD
jgi:hypothetical protein